MQLQHFTQSFRSKKLYGYTETARKKLVSVPPRKDWLLSLASRTSRIATANAQDKKWWPCLALGHHLLLPAWTYTVPRPLWGSGGGWGGGGEKGEAGGPKAEEGKRPGLKFRHGKKPRLPPSVWKKKTTIIT